jgi:hypothetical protein
MSLIILPAHSASLAGTKCTKSGLTKIVSNTKFTCVKSGNKLIWNKGTPLRSTEMDPRGKSTTEPVKPKLSDLPGRGPAGRYEYRYVDGKLQRKNIDGFWRVDDSRSSKDFDPVRVAAFESIRKLSTIPAKYSINVEEHITKNYPEELVKCIKIGIKNFNEIMAQYLNSNLEVDLVLVTEKDRSFIENDLPKIIQKQYYGNVLEVLNGYSSIESFYRSSGTGGGTASFRDSENKGYYLGHTASFAQVSTYWPEVAPHEMAHVLQFFLARGFQNSCDEGQDCAKWHGHLIEGAANTVGMAVGFPNIAWYSDEMDKILKSDIQNYKSLISLRNEADAVALFKRIETRTSEVNQSFSYSAGQVLWEYFVGTYGFEKWVELYKNLPKTANFNENLKVTIGVDKKTFYENAAPYFLGVWKRLSS